MYKNESGSLNDPKVTESLTDKLFRMAGYKNLSATSFGIFLPNSSCYENSTSNKKMYIPIFINKFRLVGLLDSGSDICIISKSVINKLGFTNIPPPKEVLEITSFSGNHIKVIGMINCLVKLHQGHKGISVDVHIINDIPNIPTVLLGNTLLMAGVATLGFTGRPPPIMNQLYNLQCRNFSNPLSSISKRRSFIVVKGESH
jgi:hypothetical protein